MYKDVLISVIFKGEDFVFPQENTAGALHNVFQFQLSLASFY